MGDRAVTDQPLNPTAIMAIRERDAEAMSGPANDQLVYRERHALLAEVDRLAAESEANWQRYLYRTDEVQQATEAYLHLKAERDHLAAALAAAQEREQRIALAWTVKGRAPRIHEQAQERLLHEWPVLARAVCATVAAALAGEGAPKPTDPHPHTEHGCICGGHD